MKGNHERKYSWIRPTAAKPAEEWVKAQTIDFKCVTGVDSGLSSLGSSEVFTPRSGGIQLDQPGEQERVEPLEPGKQKKEEENTLNTALA